MANPGQNFGAKGGLPPIAGPGRAVATPQPQPDGDRSPAELRRERKMKRKLREARLRREAAAASQTPAADDDHDDEVPATAPPEQTDLSAAAILESPTLSPQATLDETLSAIEAAFASEPVEAAPPIDTGEDVRWRDEMALLAKSVEEKDQLITALTERLEQAAEQLDRLHRSGADRGRRGGGGGAGLPPELVQDQRAAIDELRETINRWEEMQAGLAIGRMEIQLGEIRDLIVGLGSNRSADSFSRSPSRPAAFPSALPRPQVTPPATPPAGQAPSGATTANASWWERQKAALLGEEVPEEPVEEQPAPTEPEPPAESHDLSAPIPRRPVAAAELGDLVLPDPPAAVDLEALTLEEARTAIVERDRTIDALRESLLLAKMAGILHGGIGTREALPADQQQRLEQLEAAWEARFRKQELELSIERARLAREHMTLRQQQEALRKELERLQEGGSGDSAEQRQERRWFRFMNQAEGGNGAPGKGTK